MDCSRLVMLEPGHRLQQGTWRVVGAGPPLTMQTRYPVHHVRFKILEGMVVVTCCRPRKTCGAAAGESREQKGDVT